MWAVSTEMVVNSTLLPVDVCLFQAQNNPFCCEFSSHFLVLYASNNKGRIISFPLLDTALN